jgi:polar amino acid transport system substrate-binding protein
MKKYLLSALILTLCMFLFSACGNKGVSSSSSGEGLNLDQANQSASGTDTNTTEKKSITVALDASYKPMEWQENGEIVGFEADLMKAIAKAMNKEVKLKNVGWNDIFDKLYAGEYDAIISSVTINDERKKSMLFSDPYYDSMPTILTTKSQKIKSAKDLTNKKVAVQKGTTGDELISKNIANVKMVKFDNADLALNSFANKEVDAVVGDAPVLLDFAKQKADPEYVVVKDESIFAKEQFGIAVSKENQNLISDINKALAAIKANGEYQKIYDKYFKAE